MPLAHVLEAPGSITGRDTHIYGEQEALMGYCPVKDGLG